MTFTVSVWHKSQQNNTKQTFTKFVPLESWDNTFQNKGRQTFFKWRHFQRWHDKTRQIKIYFEDLELIAYKV